MVGEVSDEVERQSPAGQDGKAQRELLGLLKGHDGGVAGESEK